MLPLAHRLRHEKDIKTLFQKGKSVFDAVCGLKYRKNDLETPRFAVVVGTKISKSAVVRNRIKRRIRAILEAQMGHLTGGFDVMMIVRAEALKQKPAQLEAKLVSVLKKTPLWHA